MDTSIALVAPSPFANVDLVPQGWGAKDMTIRQLFGHVRQLQASAKPWYSGLHALLTLRGVPDKTILILAKQPHLQTLLELALQTGAMVAVDVVAIEAGDSPTGNKVLEECWVDSVTLYDHA